jgi:homoserine kinase type II
VNPRTFDELLAGYPSWVQPRAPIEPLGGAGGFSGARLWRFRSERDVLVLRAWPSDGPDRERLERIHHWRLVMAPLDFVPVPVRDRGGRSLQEYEGRFWEICPWLAGEADSSHPPAAQRLAAAFRGLAALHLRLACEEETGVSLGLGQRRDAVRELLAGGLDSLEAAIRRQPGPPAGHDTAALRWLALARAIAPDLLVSLERAARTVVRIQPCLRDARPDHFLFEDDRLTGLVDFGAMGVDTIAGDLARLIGEWLDGDSDARGEALSAYERIRPLDPAETALIGAFERSADLLIAGRWVRWHYVENRRFDDPKAVPDGLARGLKRLERLAHELMHARFVDERGL